MPVTSPAAAGVAGLVLAGNYRADRQVQPDAEGAAGRRARRQHVQPLRVLDGGPHLRGTYHAPGGACLAVAAHGGPSSSAIRATRRCTALSRWCCGSVDSPATRQSKLSSTRASPTRTHWRCLPSSPPKRSDSKTVFGCRGKRRRPTYDMHVCRPDPESHTIAWR